jgi:hypothetical protein
MENRNTVLMGLAVLLYTMDSIGLMLKLAMWFGVWYFTGGKQWSYLFINTMGRDYRSIKAFKNTVSFFIRLFELIIIIYSKKK